MIRVRKNITSRFRPDRFSETCQVLTELNRLQTLSVTIQSYKFIRQTRRAVKRTGCHDKGRWPGVLARRAWYI